MIESWSLDNVRAIFAVIDRAIYSLIATVYEILLQITSVEIFHDGIIEDFASRIYGLLGIFMLFKVSFSLISYLVHPDDFTDKSKGAQKIILNVIIVLILIIITPTAFRKLSEVQNAILNDNIIPQFILGTKGEMGSNREYQMSPSCSETSNTQTDGDYLAILTFRPFFQPEEGIQSGDINNYCSIGVVGQEWGSVSKYLDLDIVNLAPGILGKYVIDYKYFISTITGIVILLILVSFCFDIAVRTIKLGFLQIMAPIPIISYVDPKSGKDGMFKKWIREVGKTWASLFIRLIALFFGIYIIKLIGEGQINITSEKYKFWTALFIIIGALIFAKQLPKLLENMLGIKFDSKLTLNPMKKIRDEALGGKIVGGIPGAAAGLAGGAIAGGIAGREVGATKRGMIMGALGGIKDGFRSDKGAFTKSMREQYKNLTGNEMARLSLGKLMLNRSGQQQVDEIKNNLKTAYSNLNNRQTTLNVSEHLTAELAQSLRSKGYDITNMENATKQLNKNIADQTSKIEQLKNEQNNIVVKDSDGTVNMEKTFAARSEFNAKIEQEEKVLRDIQADRGSLAQYTQNIATEEALRREISDINKNIDTMKSQKAQAERFYQIDKSPQQDYDKAVADENERSRKLLK